MIKLKQLFQESFFKSFQSHRIGISNYVEIFKNPVARELKASMGSHNDEVGAVLLDKDIYTWNRSKALHVEAMRKIEPNMRDMLPVLITFRGDNCAVYVTDASRHTKWYRQPETWEYIQNHPFFKFRTIEDISYWDEDINGKWEDSSDEGHNLVREIKNPRLGKCYELAGRYVSHHPGSFLVHGKIHNPYVGKIGKENYMADVEHAWVETKEGNIYDPVTDVDWTKDAFEAMYKPIIFKKYDYYQTLKMMLKFRNWGPWET